MKAPGHGDGWDVVGEGDVEGIMEVSGWATGWRVGMLEGLCQPGDRIDLSCLSLWLLVLCGV